MLLAAPPSALEMAVWSDVAVFKLIEVSSEDTQEKLDSCTRNKNENPR